MSAIAKPAPLGQIDERAEQIMVRMRDGVRLATDVYLPHVAGRVPTVLVRLPYDKTGAFSFMPEVAPFFTERGYAFVVQDVRGKARSEGDPVAFVHETADGAETLDRIVAQPWSDGAVGMFGDSYYGFTQWAAAAAGHPALRAIVPRMTTTEIGTDWVYHQGVFCLYAMVEWAAQTWVDRHLYEDVPDWSTRPLDDALPALHGGRRSPSLDRWRRTPPADPFWTRGIYGTADVHARVRIPALHTGGWWDVFQRGQIRDYRALRARGVPGQHLVMGSTDHFDDLLVEDDVPVEDYLLNPEALARWLPGYVGPALEFLDRHLRGVEGDRIPEVRWHLANEGWRTADGWPPAGSRELTLHLADGGRALRDADGGALATSADAAPITVAWTHDAGDPVPDLVADVWRPLLGLPDDREVEGRADVPTFTGDPVREPLDLAGPIVLDLEASAGRAHPHVMAKLVDVFPSGRARRIVQGAALASSGERVRIDLGNTGYRLRPDHRLRLELASSCFPRYLLDPGDARDPWTATEDGSDERGTITGGASEARLMLTVI